MLVRLMGEGQYRVSDEVRDRLSELDGLAGAAADAENEEELDAHLDRMWDLVRTEGERLPDD